MSRPRLSWWEIQVPDLEQAKAFYGEVFGWSFEPYGDDFVIIKSDGEMIGGLDVPAEPREPAGRHVLIYFDVDDLEETVSAVERAGGTVVRPRGEIGNDWGWYAIIADPSGLKLGLTTSRPPR